MSESDFIKAAKKGDINTVQTLGEKVDINSRDGDGKTALHHAVYEGRGKVIQFLVNRKDVDVNIADNYGCIPLHYAAGEGHASVAAALLSRGTNVNQATNNGESPLWYASNNTNNGNPDAIRLLLSRGANVNQTNNNGDSPMHRACLHHDAVAVVSILLSNGADFNLTNKKGQKPIEFAYFNAAKDILYAPMKKQHEESRQPLNESLWFTATMMGDLALIQQGINDKININCRDSNGRTAVHWATFEGHLQLLEYLITQHADLNIADNDDTSPLHQAAVKGPEAVVAVLLSNGADVNQANKKGQKPIDVAKNQKIKDMIIAHTNKQQPQPLPSAAEDEIAALQRELEELEHQEALIQWSIAAQNGDLAVIQHGINNKIDINCRDSSGCTAVKLAVQYGHLQLVEYLISQHADLNIADNDGTSPLHQAALKGQEAVVTVLLSNGADVNQANKKGQKPIDVAKNQKIKDMLIAHTNKQQPIQAPSNDQAVPKIVDESQWFQGAKDGHFALIQQGINDKIDINCLNSDGRTALYWAARNGHLHLVEYLISQDADLNIADNNGDSPLWVAARNGHDAVVAALLSHGADINQANNDGQSPLYWPAINGQDAVVAVLLSHGAAVNQADSIGKSFLYWAALKGHVDVVAVLLSHGADIHQADNNGKKPIDVASNQEIKDMLVAQQVTRAGFKKSDFDFRGVNILLFRAIAKEALERNPDKSNWTVTNLCEELIRGSTHSSLSINSSLIDMLKTAHQEIPHAKLGVTYRQVVGAKANVFLSCAWRSNFMDLVEGLELFLEDENRDPITTCFWFNLCVDDQWKAGDHDFDWWTNTFAPAVQSIGETVMFLDPWEDPIILNRAWCVFEISCSEKVSVAISRAEKDSFVKALREDPAKIYDALCNIDLEKAIAFRPEDMENISKVVRAKEGGFPNINMKVAEKMRGWVEKTAKALVHGLDLENDQMTVDQLKDLFSTGLLLLDGGKYEEANRMFERALEGFQQAIEFDHPNSLGTINKPGALLQHQAVLEEATHTFERVLGSLEGDRFHLGRDSPITLDTVNNLGSLFSVLGKYDEAQPLFERALQGFEQSLGPDHLTTLKTVNNLANLLKNQGNLDEAKVMFERAKSGFERALGSDHKTVVEIINNLAAVVMQMAIKKGEKPWGRSTVIFVGAGRAGKTGTERSMLGYAFEHTESTVGINNEYMFEVTSELANVDGNANFAGGSRWLLAEKAEKEYESALAKLASAIQQGKVDKELEQKVAEKKAQAEALKKDLVKADARVSAAASAVVPSSSTSATAQSAVPSPVTVIPAASAAGGGNRGGGGGSSSSNTIDSVEEEPLALVPLTSSAPPDVDLEYALKMLAKDLQMNSKLLLTFLDFGGQKAFESINQFFMVEQAVYVVVFNMECFLTPDRIPINPEKGITTWSECLKVALHWLNTVVVHTMKQGNTKPAPIFIIGTHKDSVPSHADHQAISEALMAALGEYNPALNSLQRNDTEGLCFYPIDNTRGRSDPTMTTLMKRIEAVIETQDYVKKMLPLLWFRVLDWMNGQSRFYLKYEEVAKFAKECGFDMSTSQAVDDMLSMFHECSVLMWHNVDGLRHIVILSPIAFFVAHATNLLRQHTGTATDATQHKLPEFIENKIQSDTLLRVDFAQMISRGIVTRRLLDVLLSEAEEPQVVMQLMITYALLVPLVRDEGDVSSDGNLLKYLVPALLPEGTNEVTDQTDGHRFVVFFSVTDSISDDCLRHGDMRDKGFLPGGLFPRLIAKLLVWSQQTTTAWSADKDSMTLFFGNQKFHVTHQPGINAIEVSMFDRHTPLAIHARLKNILDVLKAECFQSLHISTFVEHRGDAPMQGAVRPSSSIRWLVPLSAIRNRTVFLGGGSQGVRKLTEAEMDKWFESWLLRTGLSDVELYDVFLSYRWHKFMSFLTAKLADFLAQFTTGDNPPRPIITFLDTHSLEMGLNLQTSFVNCLVRARVMVAFVSWAALARMMTHDAKGKETTIFTMEDNVLIEWLCSLRLVHLKRIHVMPLFLGNCEDTNDGGEDVFKNGVGGDFFERDPVTGTNVLERLPNKVAEPSVAKAVVLLTKAGVWTSGTVVEPSAFGLSSLSVRAIVTAMTGQLGIKASDSKNTAKLLRSCATEITAILAKGGGAAVAATGGVVAGSGVSITPSSPAAVSSGGGGAHGSVHGTANVASSMSPVAAVLEESGALADRQTQCERAMFEWLFAQTPNIHPNTSVTYAKSFYTANITTIERLARRIGRESGFLLSLGIDEDDAEDIVQAMRNVQLLKA